jgi:hypothetical protein
MMPVMLVSVMPVTVISRYGKSLTLQSACFVVCNAIVAACAIGLESHSFSCYVAAVILVLPCCCCGHRCSTWAMVA